MGSRHASGRGALAGTHSCRSAALVVLSGRVALVERLEETGGETVGETAGATGLIEIADLVNPLSSKQTALRPRPRADPMARLSRARNPSAEQLLPEGVEA